MNKRLSIIVPIYNVEQYVRPCLESILKQGLSEDDYEIILINDGTLDRSMEVIADLVACHPNIKVIPQENKGLSAARNTGLIVAEGTYVLFCDSDDLLIEGALPPVLDAAMHKQADMVIADYLQINDGDNTHMEAAPFNFSKVTEKSNVLAFSEDFTAGDCHVWRFLFLKSFLMESNIWLIPGLLFEDIPFTHECYLKAKRFLRIQHPIYIYRRRNNSISTNPNVKSFYDINTGIVVIKHLLDLEKHVDPIRKKMNQSLYLLFHGHLWRIASVFRQKEDTYDIIDDLRKKCGRKLLFRMAGKPIILSLLLYLFPHRLIDYYRLKKHTYETEQRKD